MKALLREPLLHFLAIGLVLFAAYGRVAPPDTAGRRIVVDEAVAQSLARQYRARWNRDPGEADMAGLVEAWIRDELAWREGTALGLGQDDPVIKRRVRQKLEVLLEEQAAAAAPGDAELAAYLAAHPERFRAPARVGFEQVLFDGAGPGPANDKAIAAARAALAKGVDPSGLGRAGLLPARVVDAPLPQVAREFGQAFATRLETLEIGEWRRVPSSLGEHLVRVRARSPGAVPPLDAVRVAVERDWENDRRTRSLEAGYARIRAGYEIVVDPTLRTTVAAGRP